MNNYNPYFMGFPGNLGRMAAPASGGIFSKLLGRGLNFGSIITNTQKTLGVVNQAIPIIKQVQPMVRNAGTMFKVMNEFKKVDTPSAKTPKNNQIVKTENNRETTNSINSTNGPTFFL